MHYLFFVIVVLSLFPAKTGAATGARPLADLNAGAAGSYPSNFTMFGGSLYFTAYTFSTGFELWKYDGNTVSLAADINPTADDIGGGLLEGNDSIPDWLTEFGGQLYFSAFHPGRGDELWRYDGVQATRVSDINPDQNDAIKVVQNSAWPSQLTVLNQTLFFAATSSSTPENYELWKYNAADGVQRVANLRPDIGTNQSGYPTGLITFNGALYFMANDGSHGWELWKHDGIETKLFDLNPGGPESSSYPKDFVPFNGELYFPAYTDASGFELWKTDGATATLAADVQAGPASSYPKYLTAYNGALYFQGFETSTGNELRKFVNGQATLAADINPSGDSAPKNLTVLGNLLVFAANDGVHGWELWKYDGATATMVMDLNTTGDSFPEDFRVLDGVLYFTATTPETGFELFKFDGVRITLAAEINVGPGDSFPREMTVVNGHLYFSATDNGTSNWEPWILDVSVPTNQPPTVSLTAPANGATFLTTDSIAFSATAAGEAGIARVEFYSDGTLLAADNSGPFGINVSLAAGTHVITAKAIDLQGASATSAGATITVREPTVNQPPTVSLTAPAEEATFLTNDPIVISATASDDSAVARVEFFANGSLLGTDNTAPYSITANLTAGTYAITARAFDATEASGTSTAINITVREPVVNQPPTVSLTAPAEGATFLTNDPVVISATASDDSAVARVEFFANGSLLGTDNTAPYSITTNLTAGTYAITARAFDAVEASGTSTTVNITVREPAVNQPPTVSLTTPAGGALFSVTDSISIAATATDDAAVARVEFYAGSSLVGTDDTAPYNVQTTLTAGTYSITAKAYDFAGASTTSAPITISVRSSTTSPPTITSIVRTGLSIVLTVSSTSAQPHAIQASSDLANWTTVDTKTPIDGAITFTDSATEPKRFYRVLLP